MKNMVRAQAVAALVFAVSATGLHAKEMKISGTVEYEAPKTETMSFGGETLFNLRMPGIVRDDGMTAAIDGNDQICFGTMTGTEDGKLSYGTGYCVQTDADGDVWWLTWTGEPGATEWTLAGGTGKFAGAQGHGTTKLVSQADDGAMTVRYDGTMAFK